MGKTTNEESKGRVVLERESTESRRTKLVLCQCSSKGEARQSQAEAQASERTCESVYVCVHAGHMSRTCTATLPS